MHSQTKLYFSRFAHSFEKDNIVGFMNSLKMRPVFVDKHTADAVSHHVKCNSVNLFIKSKNDKERKEIKILLKTLIDEKILIHEASYDDIVLNNIRDSISSPKVSVAYFIMTDECNLDCSYCFIKKGMSKEYKTSSMTETTADAALQMLSKLSDRKGESGPTIVIYGGEPLLNSRTTISLLKKISDYKKNNLLHKKTTTSIITNGTLLTEEILHNIKYHDVQLAISIDGTMIAHSKNRKFTNGSSSYGPVMEAINRCNELEIKFAISSTISWETINNFNETIDAILNILKPASVGFNILMDNHGSDPNYKEYSEKSTDFIIKAYKIFREHGIYEDRIMRKIKSFIDGKLHIFDCAAAGGNQIVIAPDGQVGICQAFLGSRKYFVSHVNDTNFDPVETPAFNEWNDRTPFNMKECLDCQGIGICGGGCPHNAYINTGSIWGLDERFCTHTKKTLDFLVWDVFEATKKTRDDNCNNTITS